MRSDYVVVGKISQLSGNPETIQQLISTAELKFSNIDKKVIRKIIVTSISLIAVGLIEAHGIPVSAATIGQQAIETAASPYSAPAQLGAITSFIKWLISIIRWMVSIVIGLIATYAGFKMSTDISGSGVSEAKKILKNCASGAFFVQFGATLADFFISKLSSFL